VAKKFLIISCDGGGVKGYLSARMIDDLQSDCDVVGTAGMFAGTSTGSIIALGLASGLSTSELVNFYGSKDLMAEVFTPYKVSFLKEGVSVSFPDPGKNQHFNVLKGKMGDIFEMLLYPKYFGKTREAALRANMKDILLQDLKKKVAIATFQINSNGGDTSFRWCPVLFHNLDGSITSIASDNTVSTISAAMCSSAAPTYFPPYQIGNNQYIDGGVYANNPSAFALAALLHSGDLLQQGLSLDNVYMLSIGTGKTIKNYPFVDLKSNEGKIENIKWGALDWFIGLKNGSGTLLDVIMDGSSECEDFQSAMILNERYCRADIELTTQIPMDDYNAIDTMKIIADKYLQSDEWKTIKSWVKTVVTL
jgi:patatin-like phospholipase/acyl hydrolase